MFTLALACLIMLCCSIAIYLFLKNSKLQRNLTWITFSWFLVLLLIYTNHYFIDVSISKHGILNFQGIINSFINLFAILAYPILVIQPKLISLKYVALLISPAILTLITYIIWHLANGLDLNYYYSSLEEFWAARYSMTIILRLILLFFISLYFTVIILSIWQLIPLYNKYIIDNYSDTSNNVIWLKSCLISIACIAMLYLVMFFYRNMFILGLNILTIIISLTIITVNACKRKVFVVGDNLNISFSLKKGGWYLTELIPLPSKKIDYKIIMDKFDEWMDTEQPFLDSNFSINDVYQVFDELRYPVLTRLLARRGYTFQSYVRRYRISTSCRLMQSNPKRSIKEIAYYVGFSSADSFSRAFSTETGSSPKDFRQQYL